MMSLLFQILKPACFGLIAILLVWVGWVAPAHATAEKSFGHSTVRLVAGGEINGNRYVAVDIQMGPGWKTYWRMPGEAGIPPQFDWSNSRNLAEAQVKWPSPGRYTDASGETIGYKTRVMFPVAIKPRDAGKSIGLELTIHFALCNDICLPASARLSTELPAVSQSRAASVRIREFLNRVPRAGSGPVSVKEARVQQSGGKYVLRVSLAGNSSEKPADIFVEGADRFYFRKPNMVSRGNNLEVYEMIIDGLRSSDQLKAAKTRMTVVTGTHSLVQTVVIQ